MLGPIPDLDFERLFRCQVGARTVPAFSKGLIRFEGKSGVSELDEVPRMLEEVFTLCQTENRMTKRLVCGSPKILCVRDP